LKLFDFLILAPNPAVHGLIMQRCVMVLLLFSCGCATTPPKQAYFDLSTLPSSGVNSGWSHKGPIPASVYTWNLGKFIPAAVTLQAMGREAGSQALLHTASMVPEFNSSEDYEKVVVLCRMLFKFKDGVAYRYASLGGREFFGNTAIEDWPLEPIELVDGYPFWIVQGLNSGGMREPVSVYVSYCITNCEWNTVKYRPLSVQEKHTALAKLLDSKKWKRPLSDMERWVLSSQIE
jgi:hypothetical protein